MVSGGQVAMEIEVEGLRSLHLNLDKVRAKVGKAGDKALQEVGLEIVAEAKDNIRRNGSYTFGHLSASGKVQKSKDGGVDAGFFSSEQGNGYAAFVEYGRGPTKTMAKGEVTLETGLKAWIDKKLGIPAGKKRDRVAFLIARKIHRKGTKAQPFFVPAVKKIEGKIAQIVDGIIKRGL